MKKLLNASFIYMLAGVASGLFYREFTKLNDFPEASSRSSASPTRTCSRSGSSCC